MKKLPKSDQLNVMIIYGWTDKVLWLVHHMQTKAWFLFSCNKKSMCQRVLKCSIKVAAETSEEEYWELILVLAVNNKYSFNKFNLSEANRGRVLLLIKSVFIRYDK